MSSYIENLLYDKAAEKSSNLSGINHFDQGSYFRHITFTFGKEQLDSSNDLLKIYIPLDIKKRDVNMLKIYKFLIENQIIDSLNGLENTNAGILQGHKLFRVDYNHAQYSQFDVSGNDNGNYVYKDKEYGLVVPAGSEDYYYLQSQSFFLRMAEKKEYGQEVVV